MQSDQVNEIAAALAKAQAAIPNATMDKINPHFKSKYASLASVVDSIREPLAQNGLAVTQTMSVREDGFVLLTLLLHSSGQWIRSEYPLPAVARPQEMGSALTYARRYSLAALVCNAADEDDDAEGAETRKQTIAPAARKPKPPAPNPIMGSQANVSVDVNEQGQVAGVTIINKGSGWPDDSGYDPQTGEVPFDEPAPEDPAPDTREVAAILSLKAMAREAAMRGEDVFKKFYKNRTGAEKAILNQMGDELRGLMAEKTGG